jgi:hypothetical protein
MLITDTFKQFCKERHAEDKGKHYDLLQEVYANTEFFDLSLYMVEVNNSLLSFRKEQELYKADILEINLPFQNCFIKIQDNMYVFLREYSPNVLTGTIYATNYMAEYPPYKNATGTLNIPFTIQTTDSNTYITSDFHVKLLGEYEQDLVKYCFIVVRYLGEVLNNLSKKSVIVDKVEGHKVEYYRRKNAPVIKIPARPIYYILDKNEKVMYEQSHKIKARGTLEITHSFRVRGHWRKISEKSLGKDRNGKYGITGYTWVTDYIKGEGELSKKLHVIK